MYLDKRHRKWWALHDVPRSLQATVGTRRLAQSLGTEDEKLARRRAALLWLHDWSKRLEQAKSGAPATLEAGTEFYRRLLREAPTEEERRLIESEIAEEAADRRDRALSRAGIADYQDLPDDVEVPGLAEADRFFALASGKATPFLEHLEEWLLGLNNEPKTKAMKRASVTRFAQSFALVQDVNRKEVQRWLNRTASEGKLTAATIRRTLSELRSYWTCLVSLGAAPEEPDPFARLTIPGKDSEDRRPFEPAEVVTLMRAAEAANDRQLADLITLGMWTGARLESLCNLKVQDVHREGFIRIASDKTAAGRRDVPIHPKLKRTIKRLTAEADADGFLLPGLEATKYGDRSGAIGKRFGRLKAGLGFGDSYVFHSIRKTVATMLENAGVLENVAADILGHEKPRITYGLYSGGASLETKREAMCHLAYPVGAKKTGRGA